MKTIARVMLGTVCIWLTGIVSAFGVNYTFETDEGWILTGSAAQAPLTPGSGTVTPGKAISMIGVGSASTPSAFTAPDPATDPVITDFWTKPVLVTDTITPTDEAAVQFAFKAGNVMVLKGDAVSFTDVPTTADVNTWLHVTVIRTSSNWTLKLNGTAYGPYDLHSVSSQTPWFSVANGSGLDATLLDDVQIFANTHAALEATLTAGDAKIAAVTVSGGTVEGAVSAALALEVRAFNNYACTSPDTSGRLVTLGGSGANKTFTDSTGFTDAYYKLVISADGSTKAMDESTPKFAAHKQDRSGAAGSSYWVGSMINYGAGNDSLSAGAALGEQLKGGLAGGEDASSADSVVVYDPVKGKTTYWLSSIDNNWYIGASTPADSDPVSVGSAFLIQTKNNGSSTKAVFAGPQIDNGVSGFTHALPNGWFMFSYPFEGTKAISTLSDGVTTGDLMYLYRGTSYKLLKKFAGGWRLYTGGALPVGYTDLQFGEGVFYYSSPALGTTLTLK